MRGACTLAVLLAAACGDNWTPDRPPTIETLQLTTLEDTPVSGTIPANDPDGESLGIELIGPQHGTVTRTGLAVTYTPDADYAGRDQIVVIVSAGMLAGNGVIEIDVAPVNDAPIAIADAFAANEDVALVIPQATLRANDSDVDGDPLAVTLVANPVHGTVAITAADVTFTPDANYEGPASFDYTISDGAASAIATVAVAVGGANDAPVATDDTGMADEDVPFVVSGATLVANDTDTEGQGLSVTAVSGASNGAVSLAAGIVTFTPTGDYNGTAGFDYTVSDGAATDVGHVTLTLGAIDDAPVAGDDTAFAGQDVTAEIAVATLLANDTDVDGPGLAISSVQAATHGTVGLATCGTFGGCVVFTPDPGYVGPAQFQYTLTSGGLTDTGSVAVTVEPSWGGDPICARSAGGSSTDAGTAVAADTDGSVVIAGYHVAPATFGAGEPGATTLSASGLYVARYRADCTLAWVKQITGPGNGAAITIAVAGGNLYVTGTFTGSAVFGPGEANETTLAATAAASFVARFTSDGALVWARRIAATTRVQAAAVTTSSLDGRIYIAGWFQGQATFAPGELEATTLTTAGAGPVLFVAHYTPGGVLVRAWSVGNGATAFALGFGIAALANGSALITGELAGTVTFGAGEVNETTLTSAEGDVLIARYNPNGTLAWVKRAGGIGRTVGFSIVATPDETALFVAGYFRPTQFAAAVTFGQGEPAETTLETVQSGDAFFARYDVTNGALTWVKQVTDSYNDEGARAIAPTSDGGVVVTGWFGAPIGGTATLGLGEPRQTTLDAFDQHDIYVARYTATGSLVWAKQGGGGGASGYNDAYGVAVSPNGSATVTGRFDGAPTFNPGHPSAISLTSAGATDAFVVRFNP